MAQQPLLQETIRVIESGLFSDGDGGLFRPLVENLVGRDPYYVFADFNDYLAAHDRLAQVWRDQTCWQRMSVLNTARSSFFSSDRAIRDYAEHIWNVQSRPLTLACDLAAHG